MVGYIDQHRDEFGVEPICRVLQVAPSTYYAAKHREVEPSARALRAGRPRVATKRSPTRLSVAGPAMRSAWMSKPAGSMS